MTDTTIPAAEPESFADLPIQPTGSGVADLEIAYEQMRLADDAAGGDMDAPADPAATPIDEGAAVTETEAHPS